MIFNSFLSLFFLKNFEILLTSLGNLARIGRDSLEIEVGLSIFLFLLFLLLVPLLIFGVNWAFTFHLKEWLLLSVISLSYSDSYRAKIKLYATLPISLRLLTLLALLLSTFLLRIYFVMWWSDSLMFLASKARWNRSFHPTPPAQLLS